MSTSTDRYARVILLLHAPDASLFIKGHHAGPHPQHTHCGNNHPSTATQPFSSQIQIPLPLPLPPLLSHNHCPDPTPTARRRFHFLNSSYFSPLIWVSFSPGTSPNFSSLPSSLPRNSLLRSKTSSLSSPLVLDVIGSATIKSIALLSGTFLHFTL